MRGVRGLLAVVVMAAAAWPASGHPGGLNAEGCHNNRKTGGYHCHRGGATAGRAPASRPLRALGGAAEAAFPNCAAARAAGAAPVRRGEPGYGPHLDRDGDGVGCEPYRRR